jgi:type IV pilus assembly protein PilC
LGLGGPFSGFRGLPERKILQEMNDFPLTGGCNCGAVRFEVTGQTAGNEVVNKAMGAVIESVKSGGSIAGPLKDAPIFPPMVAQMIAIGEETGNLDTMLSKVADFYEDEVAAAIKALTSILEPIMIVLVGAIVGFIVVAMYMPMFKVYDAIK